MLEYSRAIQVDCAFLRKMMIRTLHASHFEGSTRPGFSISHFDNARNVEKRVKIFGILNNSVNKKRIDLLNFGSDEINLKLSFK